MTQRLSFLPVEGLPEVEPGADLVELFAAATQAHPDLQPRAGDVLVITQKIISKSENRCVRLNEVEPSAAAIEIAERCCKDARLVELVLGESSEVLRVAPHVLIARHRLGFVLANAGIDQSNLPGDEPRALLLPADPDASAVQLRQRFAARYGVPLALLISDSFGRPWRLGVCGVCIGCAGLQALLDLRGTRDREGRPLQVTQVALADQLCAAATLVCGEAAQGVPMVIVRGVPAAYLVERGSARDLIRPLAEDLFR